MFERLKARKALYKKIAEQVEAEEAKAAKMKQTIASGGFNYELVQELINQARYDMEATIEIPSGPTLRITRKDPFDKLKSKIDPNLF